MLEVLDGALGEGHEAARGQEAGPERDEQDQHDAEPEVGQGDAEEPDGERRAIGGAAPPAAAAEQPERHADQRGGERGEQRQLERDGQAVEDHPADRLVLAKVEAEVAARDPAEPGEVLARERLVEVEGLAQRPDRVGGGLVAEDGDRGVAGDEPHEPEDEHAHPEQERHGQHQPARRVDPGRHQREARKRARSLSEKPG